MCLVRNSPDACWYGLQLLQSPPNHKGLHEFSLNVRFKLIHQEQGQQKIHIKDMDKKKS